MWHRGVYTEELNVLVLKESNLTPSAQRGLATSILFSLPRKYHHFQNGHPVIDRFSELNRNDANSYIQPILG